MKKKFFWFQGGSNPWPHDYWPDALTSWAKFFQNPIIFIKLSIIRFIERTKIDIHGQWDHFLGWVKLPYLISNNEQFLLRKIGLYWPIFQWSRFFFPQWCFKANTTWFRVFSAFEKNVILLLFKNSYCLDWREEGKCLMAKRLFWPSEFSTNTWVILIGEKDFYCQ